MGCGDDLSRIRPSDSAACNRACGMMMSKGDRDENAVAKPAGRIWDKKQVQPLDGSTGYYPKRGIDEQS